MPSKVPPRIALGVRRVDRSRSRSFMLLSSITFLPAHLRPAPRARFEQPGRLRPPAQGALDATRRSNALSYALESGDRSTLRKLSAAPSSEIPAFSSTLQTRAWAYCT